jgi:hypothetical protein
VGLVFSGWWLWGWCLHAGGTKDEIGVVSLWGWCFRGGGCGEERTRWGWWLFSSSAPPPPPHRSTHSISLSSDPIHFILDFMESSRCSLRARQPVGSLTMQQHLRRIDFPRLPPPPDHSTHSILLNSDPIHFILDLIESSRCPLRARQLVGGLTMQHRLRRIEFPRLPPRTLPPQHLTQF